MTQGGLLGLGQVPEERSRCDHSAAKIPHAQSFYGLYLKMFQKPPPAQLIVKIPVFQRIQGDAQALFQLFGIDPAHHQRFIAHDLSGRKLADLVQKLSHRIYFRNKIITGRHIRKRNAEPVTDIHDAHDVIISGLVQRLDIQIGPRSDDPYDFPLHQPLRQRRIFHLFADGDLVAPGHQSAQISVYRMKRHPAHGRPFFETAVLAGQRQFQFLRYDLRIIKKHLVEISETVEKDAVLIFFFGLHVLLHHWCKFRHSFPSLCQICPAFPKGRDLLFCFRSL